MRAVGGVSADQRLARQVTRQLGYRPAQPRARGRGTRLRGRHRPGARRAVPVPARCGRHLQPGPHPAPGPGRPPARQPGRPGHDRSEGPGRSPRGRASASSPRGPSAPSSSARSSWNPRDAW